MDWDWLGALVLGLLGGGTIGAITTAVLTVSHERSERFRDRQFEAAGRFIAEYEVALDAAVEQWEAVTEVGEARERLREALEATREADMEQVGFDVLAELHKALRVGVDMVGRDLPSERAAEEIARSRAVVEQAIENLSSRPLEEPFASTSRELLRAMQQSNPALGRFSEAARGMRTTLHRLLVRVAQRNLLFANEDAEVVEAARQVAESLVALGARILGMGWQGLEEEAEEFGESEQEPEDLEESAQDGIEAEDEDDAISDDIQDTNQLLADFAALANERIRPRPFRPRLGLVANTGAE